MASLPERHCPRCGGSIEAVREGPKRGVRCSKPTCLFNFQDQSCPQCKEAPTHAEVGEAGQYQVTCGEGHHWTC